MLTGRKLIADVDKTKPGRGECGLWWLGQIGFIAKLGSTVVYIDPFLSPHKKRLVPPLLKPDEITNADLVLGSHDHLDHIDRSIWPAIAKASPKATFVVPRFYLKTLPRELGLAASRFVGVDDGTSVTIKGVKITGIPAAHELLNRDKATGFHPCLGFIVEGNGFTLYHSGDTCIYEGMHERLRRKKLDLMILPINGRDAWRLSHNIIGNMTYQEAVDLAGAIGPGLAIPAHYDMFAANSADPDLFVEYARVKYTGLRTCVCEHGKRLIVRGR